MELRKIKLPENKRGSFADIIIWLVVSFVIVVFFAVWIFSFNEITEVLTSIEGTEAVNISSAAQDTFGQINPAQTRGLHVLSYIMIISMALSILITNFLVKGNPVFFLVYLLVVIVAIIVSVYLSNQYEDFMADDLLGETFTAFRATSFIMLQLPVITTVIGIFGAILLFAGILRDAGLGGGVA